MLFKYFLIRHFLIKIYAIQIEQCYYSQEDQYLTTIENIPITQTFIFNTMNTQQNSIGFGIWTKYIPNILYQSFDYPQRPFDDPICQIQSCNFEGFYFMKFFDLTENIIAAIILRMNDNPIQLTHDVYVFNINSDEFEMKQINFEANEYHNIWIYTSFIYEYKEQKLMIFSNYQNQLLIFEYQINTEGFSVVIGGYKDDLSQNSVKSWQNLLFFKGKFSNILDYGEFTYYQDFFKDLLQNCPLTTQFTTRFSNNIVAVVQPVYDDPLQVISLNLLILGKRYTIQGWIRQRYDEALRYYRESNIPLPAQLAQIAYFGTVNILYQDIFNGDQAILLSYEVDLQNNNKTRILFQTYFLKIPLLTPVYRDMEQYYTFIYENDDLYLKTQEWHYIVFDFGRTDLNDQIAQLRIYLKNQAPIINNFGIKGFNSQFNGPTLNIFLFYPNSEGVKSWAKMFDFVYTTGQNEDNNEKYQCHSSCLDCDGPYQNNCTRCNEQNYYSLTQFNRCECLYLYELDETEQNCIPIAKQYNLQIFQEDLDIPCNFGYFEFNYQNQFYCFQCPKINVNSLICGDCYEQLSTWYQKPMCTFDFIQNNDDYVFIRYERRNQDIDIYYINENMELILEEGASVYCDQNQIGCYKSNNYHLGQQMKIQCKINRYFDGFGCSYCDELCINCDDTGNCLECQEQYYFDNFQKICIRCPKECLSCITDFQSSLGYKCTTCIKYYSVLEGYCQPCGLNCDFCQQDFDILKQKYFLRCLSCINNEIMTIRINAIDCKIIYIENCLYPIMYSSVNVEDNSFNRFFQPSDDFSIETFACPFCKNGYYTNLTICQPILTDFFGFCQSAILIRIIQQGIDYGENMACFLSDNVDVTAITLAEKCSLKISNCYFCLNYLKSGLGSCLECNQGYYANKLNGFCYTCPQQLNCRTCMETSDGFDDSWKKWQTPFIQIITTVSTLQQSYDFRQHMQSQNPSDYKVICTTCYDGYVLLDNICIKYCDKECLNCVLENKEYFCQNCQSTIYTKVLSVINNQCSSCPTYCEFCRERNDDELFFINPMFEKSQENPIFSYQCLKPFLFKNDNLVYDSFIGQFISCQTCNRKVVKIF